MVMVSYKCEYIEQRATALCTRKDYYKTFWNANETFWTKQVLDKIIFLSVRRCFHINTSFLNGNFSPWKRSHCFASKRQEATTQQRNVICQKGGGVLQTKPCQKYPTSIRHLTISQMKLNAGLTLQTLIPEHFVFTIFVIDNSSKPAIFCYQFVNRICEYTIPGSIP
jgi:hypothetical protein